VSAILLIVESIGLIVGSITAGILFCWVLWLAFRIIGHPAWGPPMIVVPIAFALAGKLPDSPFLKMALVFAIIAAVPFWFEGRAWRARSCRHVPQSAEIIRPE
jgi:uncharacterized membrane protein